MMHEPHNYTLGELAGALEHFGVHVSPDTLRPVIRTLRLKPDEMDLDRESGRGRVAYYGPFALWVLATAYHVIHSPRGKLRHLGELMEQHRQSAASKVDKWNSRAFFGNEDVGHKVESAARLRFVCDRKLGIDVRTLWTVAREHHRECGLGDPALVALMTLYNQEVMREGGVPDDLVAKLRFDGTLADDPVLSQSGQHGGRSDEWELVMRALAQRESKSSGAQTPDTKVK